MAVSDERFSDRNMCHTLRSAFLCHGALAKCEEKYVSKQNLVLFLALNNNFRAIFTVHDTAAVAVLSLSSVQVSDS